ncbi:RNA-guided endonuclease InsQ/TnpB family protein [Lentzea sp. JNUCC 0626]|uniref:RNA-guided endonuclease InsQ/TnpB family protein n=1 Tax=Lentzea sp. JNUCC 0626 TaxID=3367513 RepID=UPI0037479077
MDHLRYTYRLRVPKHAETLLMAEWGRCRWVWNECVAKSRETHIHNQRETADLRKRTCGPAELDKMLTEARGRAAWLRNGSSVAQQQTIRDFGQARAKALKDLKAGLPPHRRTGMPKYRKKRGTRPTLNYTRRGFRLTQQQLCLAGGISVRPVWSRELPESPTSVRIFQDSLGHWYASFVLAARLHPLPPTCRAIGVDWGIRRLATTTSPEHDLPHPQYGKCASARLTRYQRQMARRRPAKGKPASNGYRRARLQAAKAQKKVARQRQDTARKWAKRVVTDFDQIAVEDFKPQFMAKSTMARKAADASIGATKRELITMAAKHGRDLRLVHPHHTTMDCARCGARNKHALPLSQRIYTCDTCGNAQPRDVNSAHVMLNRAGLVPAGADRTRPDRPPDGQAA